LQCRRSFQLSLLQKVSFSPHRRNKAAACRLIVPSRAKMRRPNPRPGRRRQVSPRPREIRRYPTWCWTWARGIRRPETGTTAVHRARFVYESFQRPRYRKISCPWECWSPIGGRAPRRGTNWRSRIILGCRQGPLMHTPPPIRRRVRYRSGTPSPYYMNQH